MKLPSCFYQKAFWVVIPFLIVAMGSGVAAINAQIEANFNYDHEQDKKINDIQHELDNKLTLMYGNQRVICEKLGVNCK